MKYVLAAFVPLALAGCVQPLALPEDGALTRAADPLIVSPAPSGPSVGYVRQHIEEPMDWRQLNDAQAPGGGT